MDFQQRARLADAAVWAVLRNQTDGLTEAKDVEAALSGAVAALTRMVWARATEGSVTQTVEVIREMACGAAVELAKALEQPEELPPT